MKAPRPIIKKMRWPYPLIWLVPLAAALLAAYYFRGQLADRGTTITIRFNQAAGLRAGETPVTHRGVQVGVVSAVRLDDDQKQALVSVRLHHDAEWLARQGARFWIVRPEVSVNSISGLETITSGPYIDTSPGSGAATTQFAGLENPPPPLELGLRIVLHAPRLEHLEAQSPVYFRGIEVGMISTIGLSADAAGVDIELRIRRRYSPLVHVNSQFWLVNGVDVKGGLLSGMQMKVDSLRAILSGGIAFATPDAVGLLAHDGEDFPLYDEPKKQWLDWSPKIPVSANGADTSQPADNPR